MAKIDDVLTAVAQLKTDLSAAIADATAKITALIATQADPAEAVKLQSVADSIAAMDAAVKAFDPGPQA